MGVRAPATMTEPDMERLLLLRIGCDVAGAAVGCADGPGAGESDDTERSR